MEFIDVLRKRRSTRKFLDKEISKAKIKELIELANSSPSAGNIQARSIVIVEDQVVIEKIRAVSGGLMRFEGKIPIILVILAKPQESAERYEARGENLYSLQDATILTAYLQLIATEKGLSTCWVGNFDEEKMKEILNFPDDVKPVALLPLGYAAENPSPKERKSIEEIILKEV